MIGWRGHHATILTLQRLWTRMSLSKKVRNEMGLKNVVVMIPLPNSRRAAKK
jgi:hypothetical protein